jgi:peptidoglycan/xylan/chitin deacetylase (PgdA/CDA1 family)
MEIGNHSHTHPALWVMSSREIFDEFSKSQITLVRNGLRVVSIGYPNGSIPERSIDVARSHFQSGADFLSCDHQPATVDLYRIPRIDQRYFSNVCPR